MYEITHGDRSINTSGCDVCLVADRKMWYIFGVALMILEWKKEKRNHQAQIIMTELYFDT